MINLLFNALISSLVMLFIHAVTWEGNLLYKPANWFEEGMPIASKPMFGCLTCMSIWWGLLFDLIFFHYFDRNLILFLGAIGGFNVIIDSVVGHFRAEKMFDDENL